MAYALLTLLFGTAALWAARRVSAAVREAGHWPTVHGRIVERGVGEPMGGPGRSYLPHVKYTYSVAGRQYTNDQVYLIRRTGGLADTMRRLVDGLPDPVPVHYDPNDPARSYLLASPRSTFWILVVVGGVVFVVGVLQLAVALLDPGA